MMSTNSLYYFLSTVAQVLAAISALLAVFSHFKITEIKDFLVGDGLATLERMKEKAIGYILLSEDEAKYVDRLRDAVGRKSILGISEVIDVLAQKEKEEGHTLKSRPRGLQYLKKRFGENLVNLKKIKSQTAISIYIAFLAIALALTGIVFVDELSKNRANSFWVIGLVAFLTILSMAFTISGIFAGLKDQEDI